MCRLPRLGSRRARNRHTRSPYPWDHDTVRSDPLAPTNAGDPTAIQTRQDRHSLGWSPRPGACLAVVNRRRPTTKRSRFRKTIVILCGCDSNSHINQYTNGDNCPGSQQYGRPDTSAFAKQFGGNGHLSSGFARSNDCRTGPTPATNARGGTQPDGHQLNHADQRSSVIPSYQRLRRGR